MAADGGWEVVFIYRILYTFGMKTPQDLLRAIAAIRSMERGTLCRLRAGPYFNHQTWQAGRNCVRYVPKTEHAALHVAIAGYRRFLKLTQQYADLIIQRTRIERASGHGPTKATLNRTKSKN